MNLKHFSLVSKKSLGFTLGILVLGLTYFLDRPKGFSPEAWKVVGVTGFMAIWWMFEVLPLAVTALLPLILFPLLGLQSLTSTAAEYGNPIVFLFLGGFLLAQAMQNWGLHQRIALGIIAKVGTRPTRLVLGFITATALISMWVSNTATAMMMYPIGLSAIQVFQKSKNDFSKAYSESLAVVIMLSIAYGANIGGIATLIGTPPNALTAAFMEENFGVTLRFGQWMLLGVPLMVALLLVTYFILTRIIFKISGEEAQEVQALLKQQFQNLGRISYEQKIVALVFGGVVLFWITLPWLFKDIFPLSDTGIVLVGVVILFLWPSRNPNQFILNSSDFKNLPWDVLILFGGGLSLASVIESSQLAEELKNLMPYLQTLPTSLILFILITFTLFLSEVASNTATVAALLPIAASIAVGLEVNPLLFTIPLAFSASCAFMMPVGTPPNALIYGSGMVSMRQMARAGICINLLSLILITLSMLTLGRWLFKL